jgi:hypothetical protein
VIRSSAVSILLASTIGVSACDKASSCEAVFECNLKGGGRVSLCDLGKELRLVYVRPGDEQLTLTIPRIKATTHQWDGTGQSSAYSVSLVDRQDRYTVFQSVEQRSPEGEADAEPEIVPVGGLTIDSGKQTHEFKCVDDSMHSALEGIPLRS